MELQLGIRVSADQKHANNANKIFSQSLCAVPGGGTQIWVGHGCAARASKPIPIFKGDLSQKGYPFLRIFLQK